MIKWLVVIGVVAFVYYFFIKKKPIKKQTSSKKQLEADEMVECYKCNVYVELHEAILSNGKYYCSKECLKG